MTTLSAQAYIKPLLHAAKHPSSSIVGLLLCLKSQPNEIVDVIPLHHHWTTLSPMTEAGLGIAREYAGKQNPVLEVCGVYLAAARLHDTSISPTGEALAKQIARLIGREALILTIDNTLLSTGQSPYKAFTCSAPQSSVGSTSVSSADTTLPAKAPSYLSKKAVLSSTGDFDDHLENIGVSFLGTKVDLTS